MREAFRQTVTTRTIRKFERSFTREQLIASLFPGEGAGFVEKVTISVFDGRHTHVVEGDVTLDVDFTITTETVDTGE